MPKTEKVQKVTELTERIRGSEALFIADYRGLTVADVTELRRSLRDSGTRLTVAKNTLLKRAAGEAGIEGLDDLLQGPTAVAFVDGDPITAAKGLADAIRRFRTLEIRGGYMEGKVMSSAEAQALATIEPREVLLAKLAGAMKAEMSRAAYMFQALQSRFLSVLEAYREKVPGEAEPEAEAQPAEEPEPAEPEATPEADASTDAAATEPAGSGETEDTNEADEAPVEADEAAGADGKE
jgi:large subunit ribosomal protein L10